MLANPQPRNRRLIGGIAAELEATQPLQRDDLRTRERTGGDIDRIVWEFNAVRIGAPEPWATCGARIRLRVKATIRRVLVLLRARRAHREMAHGRLGPVVRNVLDDREPGAAVGAVGEWVSVPPIAGGDDIGDAIRTGRRVGSDRLIVAIDGPALHDAEADLPHRIHRHCLDRFDSSEPRRLGAQCGRKRVELDPPALDLDDDRSGGVADPAAEPKTGREVPDKGAKPHPLNDAVDREALPFADPTHACVRARRAGRRWWGCDGHGIMRRAGAPRSS